MTLLLSAQQMRAAEQFAIDHGTQAYTLMQCAGHAVAHYVAEHYAARPVLVLAGPGNNGGDGFIAAQALLAMGFAVEVALLGEKAALKGDAAKACAEYSGKIITLKEVKLQDDTVIIDALFGTGLARAVEGDAADIIRSVNQRKRDVVAVDIPSGVNSDSGEVLGIAIQATVTMTFAAKKIGHALMPCRVLAGKLIVADIGIGEDALASLGQAVLENDPQHWLAHFPWPKPENNKYQRGHALVIGGAANHAGAAKLAAISALRAGAGLVSIVCALRDVPVYAASAMALMTDSFERWLGLMEDVRKNVVLIGPGAGVSEHTRELVFSAMDAGKKMVLDADALISFSADAPTLFGRIEAKKLTAILTPHQGEFERLFRTLAGKGSKIEQAKKAAELSQSVVVLKGYDTVIAAPGGRISVNTNAPADLATAGTGDVLAGICAGMLSQGMEAFEAACAAVWLHGAAASAHGAGLISEDIPLRLPSVLQGLKERV